jgi:hypothetical protein
MTVMIKDGIRVNIMNEETKWFKTSEIPKVKDLKTKLGLDVNILIITHKGVLLKDKDSINGIEFGDILDV